MILFLKSASSRRVNNEVENNIEDYSRKLDRYIYKGVTPPLLSDGKNNNVDQGCRKLTVWRKSLLVSCSGFTVIDCDTGDLVYRVDNYCGRPSEIVLMDGSGKSVLTMCRHKTLRLMDDWVVYDGEASEQSNKTCRKKQPICYIKKQVNLLQSNSNTLAHVFMGRSCKSPTYLIEGCYGRRSCKVIDKSSKAIVAEIKTKEATNGCASFGMDVFQLVVSPGFDAGFAMSLVLLLDQMYS